jgi:threonine synthase
MGQVTKLKCVTCAREFSPGDIDYTCPDCGSMQGTLEVQYDYDRVRQELNRTSLAANTRSDMWRYLPLLPVADGSLISPLSVGGTPVYHVPALAEELGIKSIWVKDDGRNPSASYKDRASVVALAKALENNVKSVTAASTGNAAASWAALTAVAGLETIIFVPKTAPQAKLAQLLLFGATVVMVDGSYDLAFDLCCEAAEKWNWYNRSTAINPYLGEGKKTGAFELCEQLDFNPPDFVFVGVGDGCIYQGLAKGFRELYELGLIEKQPRLVGVQAKGASPLAQAFNNKASLADPMDAHTLADSISVGVPRDQVKCLQAAYDGDGILMAVSDDDILWAMRSLANRSGVFAEPAGAVGLAGLRKLVQQGVVTADHSAAIMVTGNGLKDIAGVLKASERKPLEVAPDLDAVARALEK